jgi:GTP pyrophosphokinase
VLDPLFTIVRGTHPKADLSIIERAYETAERHHGSQKRRSGDPYITHPLAVTTILAELGMTPPTLCAALLHDTVEDTDYTMDALRREFGDEVALLVDGVTKLDKVKYGDSAQAETIRKMIVAMSKDIRVLVIKLADRLHNMRTLRYLKQEKQERISRETLEIFAPLGPPAGHEHDQVGARGPVVRDPAPQGLRRDRPAGGRPAPVARGVPGRRRRHRHRRPARREIKAAVTGRPKHYYSIYQKMIVRGRDFADIYDLVGIRILVDSLRECYAVLGVLHARWNPVPGRFKDYVAMPKFNMYQSLHTTVIGPQGKPVELQIRTHSMHRRAEYGVAAHWKYKEELGTGPTDSKGSGPDAAQSEMAWLRQLIDWQQETADPGDFLDSLRFDLNSAEVYVFTPAGDVIGLPVGSTPSTSRTRSTPRSGTGASAGGSTAGSYRWSPRSTTATSSRCSRPRPPAPGRAATGWRSSPAPVRGRRSGSGSRRSAARRPSSEARTRSAASCARRACRSSAC